MRIKAPGFFVLRMHPKGPPAISAAWSVRCMASFKSFTGTLTVRPPVHRQARKQHHGNRMPCQTLG